MNNDLKKIKKKYGENMAKLCRELFPTILEQEGLLLNILTNNFKEDYNLYNDIINNDKKGAFKDYIYSFASEEQKERINVNKTPQELLSEAGYNLYRCETEKDIQYFRKYYEPGEELCTFYGNTSRLNSHYVYFAVKKDVDNIKRENFQNPDRQDLYGTSVISIQFHRSESHTLSIKNRYNHRVEHPDATFSNNLDNIIPGLTKSFAKYEEMKQSYLNDNFNIKGYVKANDGKFYKYNIKFNDIYYCPNNIIIDNLEVKEYNPDEYIVLDCYILNLKEKTITAYNKNIYDSFLNTIKNIEKISINKTKNKKELLITTKEGNIIIDVDKNNNIISYENNFIEEIGDNFMQYNETLEKLSMLSLQRTEHYFLQYNEKLEEINLPFLKNTGSYFLSSNKVIKKINLPQLEEVGNSFLYLNQELEELNLPSLKRVGRYFLAMNTIINTINLPQLEETKEAFLGNNEELEEINLPSLKIVGKFFLKSNLIIKIANLPNVEIIDNYFMYDNREIKELIIPKAKMIGDGCLLFNNTLEELDLSNCETIGHSLLMFNNEIKVTFSNNLNHIGRDTLKYNRNIIIKQTINGSQVIPRESNLKRILKKILRR